MAEARDVDRVVDLSLSLVLIIEKDVLSLLLRANYPPESAHVCLGVETYETFLQGTRPVVLRQLDGDRTRMEGLLSSILYIGSINSCVGSYEDQQMNSPVSNSYFTKTNDGVRRARVVSISFAKIHHEAIRRYYIYNHVRLANGCVVRAYNNEIFTRLPEAALQHNPNAMYQRNDSSMIPEKAMVFEGTLDQVAESLAQHSVVMNRIVNLLFNNPMFPLHSFFYEPNNFEGFDVSGIPTFDGRILAEVGDHTPPIFDYFDLQMAVLARGNDNDHRNENERMYRMSPSSEMSEISEMSEPEIDSDLGEDPAPPQQPEEGAEDDEIQVIDGIRNVANPEE